jgi:anion-transporting  ArsA/GET3 family ATPase
MPSIFDRSLIYVTGKGGVGRSTVAGALGLVAAGRGRRTIVCEVAEQGRLPGVFGRELQGPEEIELADGLWAASIDPQAALEEWLRTQVGGPLVRLLAQSSAFGYFVAAAPGARELVTIVKVWELAQRKRWKRGAEGYDLVIVDAPASGHGVGMLRTPKTYGDLARIGPIHKQADQVTRFLRNPRRTAYVGVALAEEMPVTETLEVDGALRDYVGTGLETIVVNGVYPRRFAKADLDRLDAAGSNGAAPAVRAALRAARGEYAWARGQQGQLRRLRRAASEAEVVTLPFLFEPELGREQLERLSGELDRKLVRG